MARKSTSKGLVFAATPASDFICGAAQLASMNLHVFTTGEGSPYGLALVPVVKVSSRTALAEKWHDLIDLDAGRIATGKATIEEVGWEMFRFILDVAGGRKKDLGRALGPGQRAGAVQPGAGHLRRKTVCPSPAEVARSTRRERARVARGYEPILGAGRRATSGGDGHRVLRHSHLSGRPFFPATRRGHEEATSVAAYRGGLYFIGFV